MSHHNNMRCTRAVTAGEMQPGQIITILDLAEDESFHETDAYSMRRLPTLAGVPMEIIAVNLPYIVVKLPTGDRAPFDTRDLQFMEVSSEYAAAYRGHPDPCAGLTFEDLVKKHNALCFEVKAHREVLNALAIPPSGLNPTPKSQRRPWWRRLLAWS
jgi:hypothetical protein